MAKTRITRTYGPIHFEDLDPHRFEDLIRELIYDYKDWQTIEATGRSGDDDGFDIRAYEKVAPATWDAAEENPEELHPMDGNLWMIQGKREKEIGPKKLERFLSEVDGDNPPYGYIMAASANFSKQSYDVFQKILREKGVMEFYLWGKAELEDMLHLPKNDRILFTFFGVSLVSKRRSRSTEIRFYVNNKNKLYRILEDELGSTRPVMLRDSKDTKYPFGNDYKDFDSNPRWKKYRTSKFYPHGLVFHIAKHFAYIDFQKKSYDFAPSASLIYLDTDAQGDRIDHQETREKVEDFWDHLPNARKGYFCRDGLVRYDDMLVIDEKGDEWHKFPHIFVDFQRAKGPFAGFHEYAEMSFDEGWRDKQQYDLRDWQRVKIFPTDFSEPTVRTIYEDREIEFEEGLWQRFKRTFVGMALYNVDGRYDFLTPRDVIVVANSKKEKEREFVQITHKQRVVLKEYLKDAEHGPYLQHQIDRQVGRAVPPHEEITIFEFKRTSEWQFNKHRKTEPQS